MIIYDADNAIYRFDGRSMDLAREYKMNPRGPYSAKLQQILDRMRCTPMQGRYALLVEKPFESFRLCRLSGKRGIPPTIVDNIVYSSIAEAEWDIFKRRWKDLTGHDVILDSNHDA